MGTLGENTRYSVLYQIFVKKEDLDQIRQIVKEKQIEILQIAEIKKDIDPNRDRYC